MGDFVNFELAKKLKEKGYPQHIAEDAYIIDNYGEEKYIIGDRLPIPLVPDYMDDVSAPTISQVLKWLRKEKKISVEVGIHCLLKWMCTIYGFNDELVDFTQYSNNGIDDTVFILYETYEQAALAGIEYTIDNLI